MVNSSFESKCHQSLSVRWVACVRGGALCCGLVIWCLNEMWRRPHVGTCVYRCVASGAQPMMLRFIIVESAELQAPETHTLLTLVGACWLPQVSWLKTIFIQTWPINLSPTLETKLNEVNSSSSASGVAQQGMFVHLCKPTETCFPLAISVMSSFN